MNENTTDRPQPDPPQPGPAQHEIDPHHGRLHMEVQGGTSDDLSRRNFFAKLCIGLSAVCAAVLGTPLVGFVLAPLFRSTPARWIPLGKVTDFKVGKTVNVTFTDPSPLPWAGVTANTAAWLRRDTATEFIAFSVNCTHLGCPVRWLPDAELFMCPCHGGVYYKDGTVAAGPPPKPLIRYQVRVLAGQVQIAPIPIPITTTL